MREHLRWLRVDKSVKVFNTCDEFLIHMFKAHFAASICTQFHIEDTSATIEHTSSLQWLKNTAESIVANVLMPTTSEDTVYNLHRHFLHLSFLYIDLRNAIQWENGPHVIRHWKWWLPRFLGTGRKNYAVESANLLANLAADFPRHISYIATHNRTVNIEGKPGRGKPVDQMIEHYNLWVENFT